MSSLFDDKAQQHIDEQHMASGLVGVVTELQNLLTKLSGRMS
jgi:hypothetical protein